MKKVLSIILILAMVFGSNVKANAESVNLDVNEQIQEISYTELQNLPFDKSYSYDEILKDMESNESVSNEAINSFKKDHLYTARLYSTQEVRYSKMTMDAYTFYHTGRSFVLKPIFYVGLIYLNGQNTPHKITSMYAGHIYTGDGNDCKFGGSIFYRLETGNRFFYGVYGDVYETATVTTSGGVEIGIGGIATVNYEVTYKSDFIKNIDFSGNYYAPTLQP